MDATKRGKDRTRARTAYAQMNTSFVGKASWAIRRSFAISSLGMKILCPIVFGRLTVLSTWQSLTERMCHLLSRIGNGREGATSRPCWDLPSTENPQNRRSVSSSSFRVVGARFQVGPGGLRRRAQEVARGVGGVRSWCQHPSFFLICLGYT